MSKYTTIPCVLRTCRVCIVQMPKQYPKDGEKHYSFESAAGGEGHGHGKGHGHH